MIRFLITFLSSLFALDASDPFFQKTLIPLTVTVLWLTVNVTPPSAKVTPSLSKLYFGLYSANGSSGLAG
ncbi:hypothetical protein OF377_02875 [Ureaplasma sp. ES3154-GEN]|uniref:hypothetical protein n=1 Tax=Ureaplasma sp. ES3154-GEN TaxID=2984844 RepID=UPI0021E8088F|nr:hypothetical protein [Ureaplasma sp. ES3154-GEN]MCV3743805.1 hypothetical protein [Ureaplasma sp. ES3154-GEN]